MNNGAANPLIYDLSLGVTQYGGSAIRGLVIGSGSVGSMRITGGTFDTTNSSIQDVITSPGIASASSLQIDGGTYRSNQLLLGLNNPSHNTFTVSQGSAVIDTLSFNVQDGIATVNLDGGNFETKALRIPTSTPATSTNTFNFNGGTLKAGASSTTFFPDLARTTARVKSGGAHIDTNGSDITISEPLTDGGGGGLTKSGSGNLTLASVGTFTGPTLVDEGSIILAAGASIANSSGVFLSSGAVFDVTAIPSYVWPIGVPVTSSGGVLAGSQAIDLGSATLELKIQPPSPGGGGVGPALTVQSASLLHSGVLVVTNQTGAPLGIGDHLLILQSGGAVTGTPLFNGTVGGQGIQAGTYSYLASSGGNLVLAVREPFATSISLSRQPGTSTPSVYGDALAFAVTLTPPTANGTVELYYGGIGGTLIGSATLTGGSAIITPAANALPPGSHPDIVARYIGSASHLPSISSALSPAQSVSIKPLVLSQATANDKYFDTTTAASISGNLIGVVEGDAVDLVRQGTFSNIGPGAAIPVSANLVLTGPDAIKYSITQPSGLSAAIIAASVWTGGSGGGGTSLATGTNYSPAATPTNPFNASFNGLDGVTTDLTLNSAIGGAVGTQGMVFGFAGNQTNPVTITGSTSASARIASIIVAPGAGAVTFQGTLPFILGGPANDTSHSFINDSANPLVFQNTGNWIPGGSGTQLRSIFFGGAGDITVASGIVPSVPSRMSLAKSGNGILTVSGSNTFSGGTTINTGKIIATTSTALGAGAVTNNGTLDLTAGAVTYSGLSSSLSGNGVVNVSLGTGTASTLLNGNYSNFIGTWNIGIGAAAGAGKVQMNGLDNPSATIHILENSSLFTSSGTHNASLVLYGGNTGESLGQLRIEGNATWAGNITLAGPISGTGDGHIGANTGTGNITGNIGETGGPHALVKDGDGTIILSGINSYTGTTNVNDGVLLVNSPGSLAMGSSVTVVSGSTLGGSGVIHGPVTVASGGTLGGSLTLNSAVTIQPGGTLDAKQVTQPSINATNTLTLSGFLDLSIDRTRSPAASSLTTTGSIVCGGTLRVINTGTALQSGDSFTIPISGAQVTGTFDSTLLPALDYGLAWDTSQFASSGIITVVNNTGITPSTVTLTPATTNQQIHGIGANFCLGPQSIAWTTSNFNLAFSPSGLNISFARLANSFECALEEPEIFWSGWDSDNVRFIERFRAIQPDGLLTISSWSPPAGLKSSGSANGGTLAKTGNAYRYADFANWWLRSLQYLRDNSTLPVEKAIPDFISIQNEPDFTPSAPFYAAWQAGCYLASTESSTKAGYPQALAAVKNAFQSNGFNFVKFVGPDTTTASPSVISSYVNNVPAGSFAAIAHHPYQGSTNNNATNTSNLSGLRAAYPTASLYMTEFFGDDPYGPGIPAWMQHALPMHSVFAIEKANTYLMWGLSLSLTAPNFCALGQYSKFIRPGDWRSAATSSDPNLKTTLFRHSTGAGIPDHLILVMINNSAAYSYPTVQTAAHWASDPARRLWKVYKTADDGSTQQRITLTEDLSGAALTGNRNLVLAPYSITTVVINSDAPLTYQEAWRQQYFGAAANSGNAADTFDSNNDGESNFYEFATNQDPFANTRVTPSMLRNGANLEFTYTRSKAAVLDGVSFLVEWSDTLGPGSWSTLGVTESTTQQSPNLETRLAVIPRGNTSSRFIRLRIGK